jgi:glycosyltransferase involved in cell wall biosynthesis
VIALRNDVKFVRSKSRPILVFLPSYHGGIARYASEQSQELARRGEATLVLATKALPLEARTNLRVRKNLITVPERVRNRFIRWILLLVRILLNQFILVINIIWHQPRLVLFDCFSEIFAPLWIWPHLILRKVFGIRYAVTLHDPRRLRQYGPQWWHDLSVWAAYLPFSVGMVHGLDDVMRASVPSHVELVDVPHGTFSVVSQTQSDNASGVRDRFGINVTDQVALALGYVADRKNLDVAIHAIALRPHIHLLVVGCRASSKDKPVEFYMNMAKSIGISHRVHFIDRYMPENEIGTLVSAADVVLLTYRSDFVSQSGILHLAANWAKPVLASSGAGPLVETVQRYCLGVTVEPDSAEDLAMGLDRVLAGDYSPLGWDSFRREASWKANIDRLMDALAERQTMRR